ncbi:MAG: DUF4153 domain-containing protein [Rhodospirillaceae bacterium]|nr:DUF4153 domain-containing protein [Rhodospirillaceae bacterium]
MLKNALKKLAPNIAVATKRFPIPALCSLLFCLMTTVPIFKALWPEGRIHSALLSLLFCGCFWFIALKLYAESHGWSIKRYYAIGTAGFALLAWLFGQSHDPLSQVWFAGSALFLSIFIAPFLNKRATTMQIWTYNYRLWLHILFTILAAVVLYVGILTISASIDSLFGLRTSAVYLYGFFVIATFFSPILAMTGIPVNFHEEERECPKDIRIILPYIAIPLLCVYAIILYVYTAQILVNWNLPKGGVAYMVSAFGCIGIIAYLASYPLHQNPGIINLFARYFFKILFVPLALLAVSIGQRIDEYGITEQRYTIVLCLIWLVLSAVTTLIQSRDKAPKIIFASIVFLLLAASFGPWGASNASANSQLHRLQAILEKNQMLVHGTLQKPTETPSQQDRRNISSIVDYMVDINRLDMMKPWFANQPNAYIHRKKEKSNSQKIVEDMGINYINRYERLDEIDGAITFNFNYSGEKTVREILDYDYIVINSYSPSATSNTETIIGNDRLKLAIALDPSTNMYSVRLVDGKDPVSFDLADVIKQLDKMKIENNNSAQKEFIVEKESSEMAVQLIVDSIYGKYEKNSDKPIISSFTTTMLVRKK